MKPRARGAVSKAGHSVGRAGERSAAGLGVGALLWLLIVTPATSWAQGTPPRAPIVALAQDAVAGTDDFYYFDLGSSALTRCDRLRRDPLQIRAERLRQSVFADIGRPPDQPAAAGEILLAPIHTTSRNARAALFVETSTGYGAYYDQLGKAGVFGKIVTVVGRPFAPLAAADGNFALLMRHDSSGRTVGAYLYHAGSGRGLYLSQLNRLEPEAPTAAVSGWPRLSGWVAAAELQASGRTTGYLIADSADGSLRFLDLDGDELTARATAVDLFPTFAAGDANGWSQRFASAPIKSADETTSHVLFADAATGDLAVLDGLADPGRPPAIRRLAANLYDVLRTTTGAGWRNLALVPGLTATGATHGVWLIDSLTRLVAYASSLETPESATVRRVDVGS